MSDEHQGLVLLADDEPAFQRLGSAWLRNLGHEVLVAGDAEHATRLAHERRPDAVLLDLSMPPHMDPLAGLDAIGAFLPTPVVVLTGHADHDLSLKAADRGAWDFIAKPVDPDMLRVVVARAVRKAKVDRELDAFRRREESGELGLVGRSRAIARLRDMVRRLGPTNVNVMILGPTGTGKEVVARALHATSRNPGGPFVPVHCGALPADLLESELFGHVKGSFTGAHRDKAGLVETAHRGTLFLDEVGEMPPPMQVKLLRFLQEGTFLPVGGTVQKKTEVRLLAATHRDLDAMVACGDFREDLFYRLKGVVLRTPALAERTDDIPLLASLFLRRASSNARMPPEAMAWLTGRAWPGNVRELRSVIETAAVMAAPSGSVDLDLLRFVTDEESRPVEAEADAPVGSLDRAIAELETRMLRFALTESAGNQSEAARRLGISRAGLIKKMDRLGLRALR